MDIIGYNPFSQAVIADPHPVYKKMRDQAPAYFVEELQTWAISRFADVWSLSMNKQNLTATHGTTLDALMLGAPAPPAFVFMDPPQHTKYKRLVQPPYQVPSIATLEDKIRTMAVEYLQRSLEAGKLDMYRFSERIGLHIIADIIGLRRDDIEHIRKLLDIHFFRKAGVIGPTPEGLKAFDDIREFVLGLIREYRASPPPAGTHIHAWLNANVDGVPMNDEQIFFSIFALTITGADTLSLTAAGTLYYLQTHPEQMQAVRADLSLIPFAFEETARYDQPTNILGRRISEDFELHGHALQAGQNVVFLFASANRDDREFENPDVYDMHRRPRRTLSFGAGIHSCLGQHLAKLEGKIILEELFKAAPDFTVDVDNSRRLYGEFLQGYCHVPVELKPL